MTRVRAVGLLTGWGTGVAALPEDAATAARGSRVLAIPRPALDGERFRRATRECLLGVAAVDAMLREGDLPRDAIRGPDTALIYVSAAAYGASNRLFIEAGGASAGRAEGGLSQERRGAIEAGGASAGRAEGGLSQERRGAVRPATGGTLHFPYTAPSAVPAEVAIEYGLTGGYVILVGGARAAIDALWQGARLLAEGRCRRAVVLAVETFAECEDLWARGRWAAKGPLVEAAASALLDGGGGVDYGPAEAPAPLEMLAARRAGETLACGPLVGLALARAAGDARARLTGRWRGRCSAVTLALPAVGEPVYG